MGLFFTLFWVKWGEGLAKANSPGGLSFRDPHPHGPLPRPFKSSFLALCSHGYI